MWLRRKLSVKGKKRFGKKKEVKEKIEGEG